MPPGEPSPHDGDIVSLFNKLISVTSFEKFRSVYWILELGMLLLLSSLLSSLLLFPLAPEMARRNLPFPFWLWALSSLSLLSSLQNSTPCSMDSVIGNSHTYPAAALRVILLQPAPRILVW